MNMHERNELMRRMRVELGMPDPQIAQLLKISRARVGQVLGPHQGDEADKLKRLAYIEQIRAGLRADKAMAVIAEELGTTEHYVRGLARTFGGRRGVCGDHALRRYQKCRQQLQTYLDKTGWPLTFTHVSRYDYNLAVRAVRLRSFATWRRDLGVDKTTRLYQRLLPQE